MVTERPERVLQPGQVAQGLLTITNDGDVPTRYAVEVSPGVTLPVVGFAAEDTRAMLSQVVRPGESATVRIPLGLPVDIAEGRKVVRVRIGEAGPGGEIVNLLDEEFFTGRLRVELPRVEMMPLPEELPPPPVVPVPRPEAPEVRGRILAVESPRAGQKVMGGQIVALLVTYQNTGDLPHAFSVIADLGNLATPTLIDRDSQGIVSGPSLGPGGQTTAEVPLELPLSPRFGFGMKDVLVRLVDLDRSGLIPTRLYDALSLPGIFSLVEVPRGLLPGDLDLLDPVASPEIVRPGEAVEIQLVFLNSGLVALPVNVDASILGPDGTTVDTFPTIALMPEVGVGTARTIRWTVPEGATPGSYGVQVFAGDPTTLVRGDPSTYLIREQVLDVFTVEAPLRVPIEVVRQLPREALPRVPFGGISGL
ncbi:MAG: hypothetical protein HYX93_02235 [Chloroflexi bacterium]|nr:hypothetical protein [Chloroflexota bacterium]